MGIRELRQQASELVRRASEGAEIVIAVSGYPTAKLVPLEPRRWRKGRELHEFETAPVDPTWNTARDDGVDQGLRDPW